MRYIVQSALALTLLMFSATIAYSCSCADPSIREKFRASDLVFVGQVVNFKDAPPLKDSIFVYSVTLKVERQWKGTRKPEITVLWAWDNPGMCNDLSLVRGERYLIYTNREKEGYGVYPDCGTNYLAKYHAEEIKKLNGFRFRLFARLFPFPKV
jgi:hypothetical protein